MIEEDPPNGIMLQGFVDNPEALEDDSLATIYIEELIKSAEGFWLMSFKSLDLIDSDKTEVSFYDSIDDAGDTHKRYRILLKRKKPEEDSDGQEAD